jgi:tRNA pseudouridine13 synthase
VSGRRLAGELPGTGGRLRTRDEDFVVEEIPAYTPSGSGPHVLCVIEKRGLATYDAVKLICDALGCRAPDVGTAGLKDKRAITRQQISLPPPITPEAALALELPGLRVLSAGRHGNKLKTGHLRGNRFTLVIRDLAVPADEAQRRAAAIFERLARPPGLPAWYDDQRFGAKGETSARGRALVRGERVPGGGRMLRLYASAFQSELFNRWLEARIADGLYDRVLPGDVLRKSDSGGMFNSEDAAADQARLERGEVVPTGPMFGVKMKAATPGTVAHERELAVLAAEGVTPVELGRIAGLAEGTRRPAGFPIGDPQARVSGDALEIAFSLPPGAYATIVAAEVTNQ